MLMIEPEIAELQKVAAQDKVAPFVIKERAKAIFLVSVL